MSEFVLEIGVEELPARFLNDLEAELSQRFSALLAEHGLPYGTIAVYTTPRRAVVAVSGLADKQVEGEELVTGPPVRAAYDAEGKPTKAAEGFAKTHGVDLSQVHTISTEKGEYLALQKHTGGRPARDILMEICPGIITTLSFPKRMHWSDGDFLFARPLRWILALLDSDVLPFEVAGLAANRLTYGHREHGPGPFTVEHAAQLPELLKQQCAITADPAQRRAHIVAEGDRIAQLAGGRVLWNDALLEEVRGLTEHPVPLLGDIDPAYLELPRQVLLTSMQSHQKSFGLEDKNSALLPHFLTVLNLTPPDAALVKAGWERVLRARLEDARFFWESDLATPQEKWLERLEHVVFLGPLGSVGDKTHRLESLCAWLANHTGYADATHAARAGRLSKADLVSGMVGEFDTLQGIMGGIYAAKAGESAEVAAAITEQYLPSGPASPVPSSPEGALLSIADKADTLAGCFGLAMIPTGAADPYALRRAAIGITRIIIEHSLNLDVAALFAEARRLYGQRNWKLDENEALQKLMEFFAGRVKNQFISAGHETLQVEAVLNADASDIRRAAERLAALAAYAKTPEFTDMATTFKRAANIIRKQDDAKEAPLDGAYMQELLREAAEQSLAERLNSVFPRFDTLWNEHDYAGLFALLGELRPAVDDFFNSVMVMAKEADLRRNRLNLLFALVSRMSRLADFSALQF